MFDPLFYSTAPGVQQVVDPDGQIVAGNPYNGIAVPCSQFPNSAIGHFAALGQVLTAQNIDAIDGELRQDGMMRGLPGGIVESHYGNFQPRLGVAWDPTGSGKSSIRAGGGIFYNHNTLNDSTLLGGNSPFQLAAEVFNGKADNPGGTPNAKLPIPVTGWELKNNIPVVYSWNLTVEHMFFNNTLVDAGYVGNRGRHMELNGDLNAPAIGTFTSPANTGIPQDALRPYPGIGGALTTFQGANSKYDSLQVSVQRRFTRGLQYNVAYTYSKAFDMGDDNVYSVLTDIYNPRYNWQVAGFNEAHNLIFSWVYNLPLLKGNNSLVGKALGGWEISGDAAFISGFPVSVFASGDPLGNGATSVGGAEYAGVKSGCNYRGGSRSFTQFFNTSCFYQPTTSMLAGTAAPNAIEGPGTDNVDFALMKNGPVTEWLKYQFRAEFFNVLNHPSFASIDTTVTDSTFGYVTGATSARQIQFGLKLIF
jgi:hypothetical protein